MEILGLKSKYLSYILWAAILGFGLSKPCFAVNQDALKVSYIFKFLSFVQWPKQTFNSDKQAIKICLAWDNYFDNARDLLKQQTIRNRAIIVEKISTTKNVDSCQILFFSASEKYPKNLLTKLQSTLPILTISDQQDFAANGGMIGLLIDNNRLVFEIDWTQIKSKHILIGSRLLNMAKKVF